jgi:tetratricopeptide (TPR) repeat protein
MASFDGQRRLYIVSALCVATLTFFTFIGVLQHEFLMWDDDIEITGNAHIQQITGENLRWMFTDTAQTMRYIPLSWLNWAALLSLWGQNPFVFHLQALILHTLNSVLVLTLLLALFGGARKGSPLQVVDFVAASIGALFWSVHPLRAEVVAWATQERFAQSLFFFLLAILLYLARFRESGRFRKIYYWSSVFVAALSALTYPTGALLVGILLVLDAYPLGRVQVPRAGWLSATRWVLIEKLPFLLMPVIVWILTVRSRLVPNTSYEPAPTLAEFGILQRAAQSIYVWGYYVWKPLLPLHLSPVYTQLLNVDPLGLIYLSSAALLVLLSILSIYFLRQHPAFAVLWLCHLFLLVPMLGLFEHPHYSSDRYSYMQGVLWAVLVTAIVSSAIGGSRSQYRAIVVTVSAGVLGTLAVVSALQVRMWTDSVTLFTKTIERLPADVRTDLHSRLGLAYLTRGKDGDLDRAFEELIRYPLPGDAMVPVGWTYIDKHQFKRAVEIFAKGLQQVLPGDVRTESALHNGMGVAFARTGQLQEARVHLLEAVSKLPASAEARSNLGQCLMALHLYRDAAAEFEALVELTNDDPRSVALLIQALSLAGE